MNNLKFRRQFLFTAKICSELKDWNIENLETHYLYTHPDCETTRISKVNIDLILIGHVIDPRFPDNTALDILNDISNFTTIDDISKKLYGLVGRFVLLIKKDNEYTFFNDACGLKLFFYTKYREELYAASQPLLLKLVTDVRESINHQEYYASKYVRHNIEHWIPCGTSLYENVHQLVPNHYLNASNLKQIRYWPVKQLKRESLENSVDKFSTLLKKTMFAANKKFKLALPLTSGWDSRTILSSCKDIIEDVWVYTLQYRDLTIKSNDLKIPSKLASILGLQYEIIDCRKPLNETFSEIYKNNTDVPHLIDWGEIAYGMYEKYPSERIAVKGNCAEVGRCFYYPRGKHSKLYSSNLFLDLEWGEHIDFIREGISEWFEEVKHEEVNLGYDLYDLFYWEHRIGSWQAQSQLEWDIVQDAFTPFNNRELLDIMLQVDPIHRCQPNYLFFKKAIKNLWPEVLSVPIYPFTIKEKIKEVIVYILLKIGIFDAVKAISSKKK